MRAAVNEHGLRRVGVRLSLLAATAAVLTSCGLFIVDHHQAALDFCDANRENKILAEQPVDNPDTPRYFSEDQAIYWSDEYSKTMRYAEDSTRSLRKTARNLADAYDDVRGIADKNPKDLPQDELDEKYGDLLKYRIEVRDACQPYLEELDQLAAQAKEEKS